MTKDEALKLALEALQNPWKAGPDGVADAIIAIKEALAQPEQEPVAHMNQNGVVRKVGYEWGPNNTFTALYTSPPAQRTWVGLTDDEISLIVADCSLVSPSDHYFAYAIEAKLKEKNT
jgi:hypothetical protein